MKTISLHVPEEAYAELKSAAARAGRPVADVIREAMAAWLEAHRRSTVPMREIAPHDSGAMSGAWTRDELVDEMLDR